MAKVQEGQMEVQTWRLQERGLRLIAAANHLSFRSIAMWSDDGTASTPVQRGEGCLLQHTAGIDGFFAVLAQAA